MSEGRKSNSGKLILVTGATAAYLIYELAKDGEAPSRAVLILQYVLLACALIGLIGSILRYLSGR